jgi:hypothetical protein
LPAEGALAYPFPAATLTSHNGPTRRRGMLSARIRHASVRTKIPSIALYFFEEATRTAPAVRVLIF